MFGGVEFADIDVDEVHVGVLESRFGGGGKVAVTRANPDNHVGITGDAVSCQGAGGADGAEVERIVVAQAAFAGHGLAHGDAGGLHKCA